VLVDDAQRAGIPGALDSDLEELLASGGAGHLVVASSGTEVLTAYRGLLSVARTSRSGVLLGPCGPGEAELLGIPPQRHPVAPVGRALLIHRGRAVSVQLARPPPHGNGRVDLRWVRFPAVVGIGANEKSLAAGRARRAIGTPGEKVRT
jgi:hypothetical protein